MIRLERSGLFRRLMKTRKRMVRIHPRENRKLITRQIEGEECTHIAG